MFDHLNNYKFIEITVNDKLFLLDKVITKLVYIKIILLTTKPVYRMHSFRPFHSHKNPLVSPNLNSIPSDP